MKLTSEKLSVQTSLEDVLKSLFDNNGRAINGSEVSIDSVIQASNVITMNQQASCDSNIKQPELIASFNTPQSIASAPANQTENKAEAINTEDSLIQTAELKTDKQSLEDELSSVLFDDTLDLNTGEKLTPKVKIRIDQISRLRVQRPDIKDGQIAQLVGMSQGGLSRIYALHAYQEAELMERRKLASRLDSSMGDNIPVLQEAFRSGVPLALNALLDGVKQSKDLRARLEAARELLDRDPMRSFTKKSVSESASINVQLSDVFLQKIGSEASKTVGNMNKTIDVTPRQEHTLAG